MEEKIGFRFEPGLFRPGHLCETGRRVIREVRPEQVIAKVDG
jgi:hypothetical protein